MKKIELLLVCLLATSLSIAQKATNIEIMDLNKATFKQKVWNFDQDKKFNRVGALPVILDFHASWCQPCKMLTPHLQTIQNKYAGKLVIYRIDVDLEPELAQLFEVQAMPTVIYMNTTKYYKELGYKEVEQVENSVKKYFFTVN